MYDTVSIFQQMDRHYRSKLVIFSENLFNLYKQTWCHAAAGPTPGGREFDEQHVVAELVGLHHGPLQPPPCS